MDFLNPVSLLLFLLLVACATSVSNAYICAEVGGLAMSQAPGRLVSLPAALQTNMQHGK